MEQQRCIVGQREGLMRFAEARTDNTEGSCTGQKIAGKYIMGSFVPSEEVAAINDIHAP